MHWNADQVLMDNGSRRVLFAIDDDMQTKVWVIVLNYGMNCILQKQVGATQRIQDGKASDS